MEALLLSSLLQQAHPWPGLHRHAQEKCVSVEMLGLTTLE